MKKIMIAIVVTFLLTATAGGATWKNTAWKYKGMYAETFRVTRIQPVSGDMEKIYVVNSNGQLFAFFSDLGDWYIGDGVSCIMDSRGTGKVKDDRIMTAKYVNLENLENRR